MMADDKIDPTGGPKIIRVSSLSGDLIDLSRDELIWPPSRQYIDLSTGSYAPPQTQSITAMFGLSTELHYTMPLTPGALGVRCEE